jgi:hypothetical protein
VVLVGIRRFLAPALAAIAASGCRTAAGVPMTALAFDSVRVAAVTANPRHLSVYSVEQQRSLWEAPEQPGFEPRSAAFSSGGRFLALYEMELDTWQGRLSVLEAATGKRTAGGLRIVRDRSAINPPYTIAVSSGGRYVASAIEAASLRLDDLETGAVHREPLGLERVEFSEDGTRVAATLRRNANVFVVRVFAFDGGIHQVAEFDGADGHAWVGKNLALDTPSGIAVWDAAELHVLATPAERPVRFSAFGKWLAVYEKDNTTPPQYSALKLTVYDTQTMKPVVTKVGLGAVHSVQLNATRLVAVVERDAFETFLLQIELPSGKVLSERSLGAWARRGAGTFLIYTGPGDRNVETLFEPTVLPEGRYVDLHHSISDKHEFRTVPP